MSVPGASNTILEVVVPYSRHSMSHLLGKVFYFYLLFRFNFFSVSKIFVFKYFILLDSCTVHQPKDSRGNGTGCLQSGFEAIYARFMQNFVVVKRKYYKFK
jgi:hypothetical protein